MRDEDDGLVQHLLQPHELVLHLPADERVECREGLVEEPQFRFHGERAGDADALLLAAGEFPRVGVLAPGESDQFDHLRGARAAGGLVDALHLEREGDVVEHVQMRQQPEALEHHAHAVTTDLDQLRR